jgi:hypothetical protein
VTGSCFEVDTGEIRFLVDYGMFQSGALADAKNRRFAFDPRGIAFVLLTRPHQSNGTGRRDQPARDENRLAAVGIGKAAGEIVGDRLGNAEHWEVCPHAQLNRETQAWRPARLRGSWIRRSAAV